MDTERLIALWRTIIRGDQKSWVLFESGTCVILMKPQDDLSAQAVDLLREWGPVHAGTLSADFQVLTLHDGRGWVVAGHHNDILTFVPPETFEGEAPTDLIVGLLGRQQRAQDAEALKVIHIEDKR